MRWDFTPSAGRIPIEPKMIPMPRHGNTIKSGSRGDHSTARIGAEVRANSC